MGSSLPESSSPTLSGSTFSSFWSWPSALAWTIAASIVEGPTTQHGQRKHLHCPGFSTRFLQWKTVHEQWVCAVCWALVWMLCTYTLCARWVLELTVIGSLYRQAH